MRRVWHACKRVWAVCNLWWHSIGRAIFWHTLNALIMLLFNFYYKFYVNFSYRNQNGTCTICTRIFWLQLSVTWFKFVVRSDWDAKFENIFEYPLVVHHYKESSGIVLTHLSLQIKWIRDSLRKRMGENLRYQYIQSNGLFN